MWENLGSELSPTVTVISAVLVVVVLVIALSLRNKISRTERGNEFLFWGKQLEEPPIEPVEDEEAREDEATEEEKREDLEGNVDEEVNEENETE